MSNTKFRSWLGKRFWFFDITSGFNEGHPSASKPQQSLGLRDNLGVDYFVGDIGEFRNGDRFLISTEEWLGFYVSWVGEPECEDQARDPYRIGKARIIGNIHESPELLKAPKPRPVKSQEEKLAAYGEALKEIATQGTPGTAFTTKHDNLVNIARRALG